MRERLLKPARWGGLALSVGAVLLFLASLPARLTWLSTLCSLPCEREGQLLPSVAEGLAVLGTTPHRYALFALALDVLVALVCAGAAGLLFWRMDNHPMALYTAVTIVLIGTNLPLSALTTLGPAWTWPVRLHGALTWIAFLPFFYLFPDGRFTPRWTRWLALLWAVTEAAFNLAPQSFLSSQTWPEPVNGLFWFGMWGSALYAQVYRYRRISGPVERQQTKWLLLGLIGCVASVILSGLPAALSTQGAPGALLHLLSVIALAASISFIPVAVGHAILRHRLWSVDLILTKTLLYGALTIVVIGLHVALVGGLGALFPASKTGISLLTTGLIAALVQPLSLRLQRAVNRFIYGDRDEPYKALARLGERLEATLPADRLLPTLVESVAQTLKLPYVAVTLPREEGRPLTAAHGDPVSNLRTFPLTYQGEPVGELLLAPRAPGEPFSTEDLRLLTDLSRQIGVAAHTLKLTAELQRSRERLVTTREEERRRLRRDLHDGLGPAVAAQTLKVGVARQLITRDPAGADRILARLEDDLSASLAEIRRLIYDLRPPRLDELGLVAAIQESADQYRRLPGPEDAAGFSTIIAAQALPPLPAAVEVAAYRIVHEAITNVVRHAKATHCLIDLRVADGLQITITDDGQGIPAGQRSGVGLLSMRERALELGGICTITPNAPHGTRVQATLPLMEA